MIAIASGLGWGRLCSCSHAAGLCIDHSAKSAPLSPRFPTHDFSSVFPLHFGEIHAVVVRFGFQFLSLSVLEWAGQEEKYQFNTGLAQFSSLP